MAPLRRFEDFPIGLEFGYGRLMLSAEQIASYTGAFASAGMEDAAEPNGPSVAPPMLVCSILMRLNCDGWLNASAGRGAPGVDQIRWLQPVHAGDVLTARLRVLDARPSGSRPDIGLVRFHYELLADDSRAVLSQSNWVMIARREASERPAARAPRNAAPEPHRPAAVKALPMRWGEMPVGTRIALGTTTFDAESIITFARACDPQPFHVDPVAAVTGPFGALAASGWHTASAWMKAFVSACAARGVATPRFVSASDLRWRHPVYAADTLAFDLTVTGTSHSDGGLIIRSRNTGTALDGTIVFAFDSESVVPARA